MKRQINTVSSGFVIGGKRVLTTAHSVYHHKQVKVKKRGKEEKYVARVLAIGIECDNALLTVECEEFWEGVSPVEFGDLPALQDPVTVVGYPTEGDTISVTSGVVSRTIFRYFHASTELLGKCIEIAFHCSQCQNVEGIGYLIPTPVITHFMKDYEKNGTYTGFPVLGVECQKMENPVLRRSIGMTSNQKGVRIRRVQPTAPESQVLKPDDVILSFDGVDIANDGTVPFRQGECIGFEYLVSLKYIGDHVQVKVLRNSKTLGFDIMLGTHTQLIPTHIKGKFPSYYIIGGFVFTALTVLLLLSEYKYQSDAPVRLVDKLKHSMAESPDEQVVVMSLVLCFNGKSVKNLKSLAMMVESCHDEYLKFDLKFQKVVVLKTEKAKAATPSILKTHGIPSAISDDLKT